MAENPKENLKNVRFSGKINELTKVRTYIRSRDERREANKIAI